MRRLQLPALSTSLTAIKTLGNAMAVDCLSIAYDHGTVSDTRTNLMWAAKDNRCNINWVNAQSYCNEYLDCGY